MKRYLLVVVVAVLALSAQPVAAQNASAVASEHTTFGTGSQGEPSPTQLTNMTVDGSGASASVIMSGGATARMPGNPDRDSTTEEQGLRLEISSSVSKLSAELYSATDPTTAYLRHPDGTLIAQKSISGGSVTFTGLSLSAGETVWLTADGQGSSVSVGTDLASYPITTGAFDVTAGIYDDQIDTAYARVWSRVSTPQPAASATFVGASHDAENTLSGWTSLTLSNASATATWQQDADNDGVWTNVTSTTVSKTTNVTQDLSGTTSDRWRVRIDFTRTGSDPVAELHDEGVLFGSSSPTLSDAEPPDQAKIENAVGNVSINVSDADFPLPQSDSVTVSATDDKGNSLGSTTLTSNGTASLAYSSENGENVIQWTATDAYGNSDTFSQTFETPSRLTLYNETSPSQKIQTSTEITATFFGANGERVIQRTSSDATFNFSGLPTDTQYLVTVDADGYRERTLVIDSLYEQQSFYLLANSVDASQIVFELSDPTGEFPPGETRLFVEKPIKINGSTTYRTVAADTFGATSAYSVVLAEGARYRLRIRHDGQERILGSYTPTVATTEPLRVQRIEPSAEDVPQDAVYGSVEDGQLAVRFRGGDNDTAVRYRVTNSSGDVVVPETETTGASFAHVYPVRNNTTDSYNVSYEVVDGGETVRDGSFTTGDVAGIAGRFNMDGQLLSLLSWFAIMATLGLVVIVDTRLAPAAGTGMASALTILGTVAIPAPLLGVSGVVAVLALFGRP